MGWLIPRAHRPLYHETRYRRRLVQARHRRRFRCIHTRINELLIGSTSRSYVSRSQVLEGQRQGRRVELGGSAPR